MALFTGKGDGGTTKLFGCNQERLSKASEVPEALFIVQAEVAGADKRLAEDATTQVSDIVNEIETEIPPITNFSIAGGERAVSLGATSYPNRLSSLLFAYARLANHLGGVKEESPRY